MKVRQILISASPAGVRKPGVYDLEELEALALIAAGAAVALEELPSQTKPEAIKRRSKRIEKAVLYE